MSDSYQIKNQQGIYFLTFQIVGWVDVFTREAYREIITESLKYCKDEKQLKVHAYVIMSNHVHCILSTDFNLSDIVRDFKKYTSKQILKAINTENESRKEWMLMVFRYFAKYNKRVEKYQFWTHENYAVELTSNEMIDSRIDYIHNNPVKAGIVENDFEYLYSSARNFAELSTKICIDEL